MKRRVSTAETFENTAENPELILESSWDLSQVNREKQGVYKVTGSFVIPEGYEVSDSLTLPEAYAYLSVQKKGEPQINTYSMPMVDLLEFPMLLNGFSAEERRNIQVYLSENEGNYRKIDDDLVEVTSAGIQIYYREILKKGQNSSSNKASGAKAAEISDTENSVTFSTDTVNGWKINAEDKIQIGIEKTSETAFFLRIFVRGGEVTEVPGTVVEFQTSVFGGIQSPETVKAEDVQGNQYTVSYQEKQNVLRVEIGQTGDYFLTDGESENIGDQTVEDSVEAISDGEDIGFTEEPMPEEETEQKTEQKTENSAKQFLMIILTLPAVCILVAAIIFAIRKKRR